MKWKPKTNFMSGQKTFDWYLTNHKYFSKINKVDILKRFGDKD